MKYKIKLFLAKMRWYFDTVNYARKHSENVNDYKFLVKLKDDKHELRLIRQRTNPEDPDVLKLEIEIELLDEIINYKNGQDR